MEHGGITRIHFQEQRKKRPTGCNNQQQEHKLQFAFRSPLQEGREDRGSQIHTNQGVHEP